MAIEVRHITGVVLAGGRGARMGGADKGLELFNGMPLALHALHRLAPQCGPLMINANRNLDAYEAMGASLNAPVWRDSEPADFSGPLAGFVTSLAHCHTPWLLTVPCDTPFFPVDLAARLSTALSESGHDLAVACAPDEQARMRMQAVFCMIRTTLLKSLQDFTRGGGAKVVDWIAQHPTNRVAFDQPGDASAFSNANTLAQLHALQARAKWDTP